MSEDAGDKTEDPTPRRREEAREKGNVAKSQDLTTAVLILGTMLLLHSFGPRLVSTLRRLLEETLSSASLADPATAAATHDLARSVYLAGLALAPLLAGVFLLAVLANVLQTGLIFNTKRLQPNLGALSPVKGFGRLFGGGGRSPVNGLMTVAKILLVIFVAYSAVHERLAQIVTVQQLSFLQIFGLGSQTVYDIAMRIGVLLLVLAIIDYAYQRHANEKKLRMTKQEVKEEMRRMDGDPKVKQRRRQIAMQIAGGRLKKDVPTADVIVTNPTEFAVALKYDADAMHAPRVVAKGQGLVAARIRELAIANGIPILERKPLARALFRLVDVGQEIPEQFYSAVAEILAYVYELNQKASRRAAS
jgi:flagellar biosynthetic protein FlhB